MENYYDGIESLIIKVALSRKKKAQTKNSNITDAKVSPKRAYFIWFNFNFKKHNSQTRNFKPDVANIFRNRISPIYITDRLMRPSAICFTVQASIAIFTCKSSSLI